MAEILIVTHQDLGLALLSAAESMLGPQEHAMALALLPGMGREDLAERIGAQLAKGPTLVIVDMLGGTPWNVALPLALAGQHHEVLAGASLPILLEALTLQGSLAPQALAAELAKKGQASIVSASRLLKGGAA